VTLVNFPSLKKIHASRAFLLDRFRNKAHPSAAALFGDPAISHRVGPTKNLGATNYVQVW
jgi:hypothetical protein